MFKAVEKESPVIRQRASLKREGFIWSRLLSKEEVTEPSIPSERHCSLLNGMPIFHCFDSLGKDKDSHEVNELCFGSFCCFQKGSLREGALTWFLSLRLFEWKNGKL